MKVEFKHNCEIQGQKFGFQKHLVPGIHEVPGSFVFDWFFVSLVLDGHAKILEAHVNEFETLDKEMLEKLDIKLLNILADLTEGAVEDDSEGDDGEESDDEGENEDDSEDDTSDSDDSVSDSEGSSEVSSEQSEVKVSKKKLKKKGKR